MSSLVLEMDGCQKCSKKSRDSRRERESCMLGFFFSIINIIFKFMGVEASQLDLL